MTIDLMPDHLRFNGLTLIFLSSLVIDLIIQARLGAREEERARCPLLQDERYSNAENRLL
jgi:hypothetical protein